MNRSPLAGFDPLGDRFYALGVGWARMNADLGKWGRRNLNHGIPQDTEKGGDFEQETERTEEIRFWALGRRKAGIRRQTG